LPRGGGSKGEPHNWEVKVVDGKLQRVEKGKAVEILLGILVPPVGLAMLAANSKVGTSASGKGVDQNVKDVCTAIEFLIAAGKTPTKINMMGWSRGAVTCLRIAWQLFTNKTKYMSDAAAKIAKTIPVNIFAVDPVPGLGHNDEVDAYTLNDNVKNFVATLSLHENRYGFAPVDNSKIKHGSGTAAIFLPLTGVHDDTAKETNAAGKITFYLCYNFMKFHGSKVDKLARFNQLPVKLMEFYCNVFFPDQKALDMFKKLSGEAKTAVKDKGQDWCKAIFTGLGKKERKIDRTTLVTDLYFMNFHHEMIFKKLYPVTYDAYFGAGKPTRNTAPWAATWMDKINKDLKPIAELKAGGLQLGQAEVAWLSKLPAEPAPSAAALFQLFSKVLTQSGLVPT